MKLFPAAAVCLCLMFAFAADAIAQRVEIPPVQVQDVTGAQVDESLVAATIAVGPQRDVKSLGAALKQATDLMKQGKGVRIALDPGIYREGQFTIDGRELGQQVADAVLVIESAGDEPAVITGSDIWPASDWQQVGQTAGGHPVYGHPWPIDWTLRGGAWGKHGPKQVIAHRQEMMFLDGKPMKQLEVEIYDYTWPDSWGGRGEHTFKSFRDPLQVLEPGTFAVSDREKDMIYVCPPVGTDWSSVTPEVATRKTLLYFTHKNNVVLRNLVFQHSAGEMEVERAVRFGTWYGEEEWRGRNIHLDNCRFQWNNAHGLALNNLQNVTVSRCVSRFNGLGGYGIGTIQNLLWNDNEGSFNNWRGYRAGWVSWSIGSVKVHQVYDAVFRNYRSIGNNTRGLWFDIDNRNIVVDGLVSIGNIRGLFFEISPGPFHVTDSVVAMDRDSNLEVSNASNVLIERSIFYGGPAPTVEFVTSGNRDTQVTIPFLLGKAKEKMREKMPNGPVAIRDSVLVSSQPDELLFYMGNGSPDEYKAMISERYAGTNNVMWSPNENAFSLSFRDNVLGTPQEWVRTTGERNMKWQNPQLAAPQDYDFSIEPGSPLYSRGDSLPADVKLTDEEKQTLAWWQGWATKDTEKTENKEVGD